MHRQLFHQPCIMCAGNCLLPCRSKSMRPGHTCMEMADFACCTDSSWAAQNCQRCSTHLNMLPVQSTPDVATCVVCLTGCGMLLRMFECRGCMQCKLTVCSSGRATLPVLAASRRSPHQDRPRLLVCHDLGGNYSGNGAFACRV